MPRINVPITDVPFQGSLVDIAAGGVAGDATNEHEMLNDGKTLVVIENGGVGVATATIVSVADNLGRFGDEVIPVPAGKTATAGPFNTSAWNQSGALLHIDLDIDTDVVVAGVRPAATP